MVLFILTTLASGESLGDLAQGCVPAYWTLSPDETPVHSDQFEIIVVEPDRKVRFRRDYVYRSAACCEAARTPVADLVGHLRDKTAKIVVGPCR